MPATSPNRPSSKTSLPHQSDMRKPPKMPPSSTSKHPSPSRQSRQSRYYTTTDESKYYHRLVEIRNKRSMMRQTLSILREDEEMIWNEYTRAKSKAESASSSSSKRSALPKVLAAYAESLAFVRSEIKKAKLELQRLKEEQEKVEQRLRETRHSETMAPNPPNQRTSDYVPTTSKRYAPGTAQGTHPKSSSNDPSRQSPPRPPQPQPAATGRKRNFTLSSSSSSMSTESSGKSTFKETISTETYTMRYPSSPPRIRKRKAPNPYQIYEAKWDQLLNQTPPEASSPGGSGSPPLFKFSTVPWPVALILPPASPAEITIKPIVTFLFHPKYKADGSTRRAILRTAILRWHPDKWEGKFSRWIEESERARVMEGVGAVMRCLNEIAILEDMRAK